jgi:hypothetical protein
MDGHSSAKEPTKTSRLDVTFVSSRCVWVSIPKTRVLADRELLVEAELPGGGQMEVSFNH